MNPTVDYTFLEQFEDIKKDLEEAERVVNLQLMSKTVKLLGKLGVIDGETEKKGQLMLHTVGSPNMVEVFRMAGLL